VANQQVFKEKLADFRVHQQIWTPPSWRVLRGVGWFSNVPADLDWAHTWRVLESLLDFQMHRRIWTLLTWRVLREVGGFSNAAADLNVA
jgi:hypothetical protein